MAQAQCDQHDRRRERAAARPSELILDILPSVYCCRLMLLCSCQARATLEMAMTKQLKSRREATKSLHESVP